MPDEIETEPGDVVVTSTEPTDTMFDVWPVTERDEQKPAPDVRVSSAMGPGAAKKLAGVMAKPTDGDVVQQNQDGSPGKKVPPGTDEVG